MRRAIVVVTLAAATLGIAGAPVAAKPKMCKIYYQAFKLAQTEFMAAYDAWDQPAMDYWLAEYENFIDEATAAGC